MVFFIVFSKGGFIRVFSVMNVVMYFAGVMSKAGFFAGEFLGVILVFLIFLFFSEKPQMWVISVSDRCSMGIVFPLGVSRSKVLMGAAM